MNNSRVTLNSNNIQIVPGSSLFKYYYFNKIYNHGEYYYYSLNKKQFDEFVKFFKQWIKKYESNIDFTLESNTYKI